MNEQSDTFKTKHLGLEFDWTFRKIRVEKKLQKPAKLDAIMSYNILLGTEEDDPKR